VQALPLPFLVTGKVLYQSIFERSKYVIIWRGLIRTS